MDQVWHLAPPLFARCHLHTSHTLALALPFLLASILFLSPLLTEHFVVVLCPEKFHLASSDSTTLSLPLEGTPQFPKLGVSICLY